MIRQKSSNFTSHFWLCLAIISTVQIPSIIGSHQSIHLDSLGHYHGIVIGFDNNFETFEPTNINTTIVSIMSQLQRTSSILKELMSVQISDVTIILPDKWKIDVNELQTSTSMQFDVRESKGPYRSLSDADILYTNDDKNQILTMQYGDCGEGGMAINFPMQYISDEYSSRLLAHQWLLYRYGVFNEFGFEDDYTYPVYYSIPNGGLRDDKRPKINSCYQGVNPQFKYSNNCNNETDPNNGRPVNPNCDVIPMKNSIRSSFMYSPISVSEYILCNSSTHDYQSPTKHNIICDYQSMQDVIVKHNDFERYKPNFNGQHLDSNISTSLIRFQILQNRNELSDDQSIKVNVLYALPKIGSKFLESSMETIKKIGFFQHQALFTLYDESMVKIIPGWRRSSQLSMFFIDDNDDNDNHNHKLKLRQIFEQISKQFDSVIGSGTCVFFYSGAMSIENTDIDYIESIADLLNRKNIRLQVIIYDQVPTNDVLRFFDQLKLKLNNFVSIDYAFSQTNPSSSSIVAFRTQLTSIISTILFDLLKDLTEQNHLLLKRETVRSDDQSGIEFIIDPTLDHTIVLIEMTTNGKGSDLVMNFNLSDEYRNIIQFQTFETYDKSVVINYKMNKTGRYRFNYHSTNINTFITITVRVLSEKNSYHSYKDALLSAKCWIQASKSNPLRGYVQISQGLNGPIYDADVSFSARSFTRTLQRQEITRPSNDNGRGNPDITAHDGIYSAYLDSLLNANSDSYGAAYTIVAKIIGHKIAMKPGNFGNTVMFNSKARCCGSEIKTNGDIIESKTFERIVHCGSFYYNSQNENHQIIPNYAIRDLRITDLDANNRTVSLEWSSPFYYARNDQNQPIIIKAFYSNSENSRIPFEIKQSFDREQNEAELEIITEDGNNNDNDKNSDINNNDSDSNNDDIYLQTRMINPNELPLQSDDPTIIFETLTSSASSSFSSSQPPYARYEPAVNSIQRSPASSFNSYNNNNNNNNNNNGIVTNSLRQIRIRILSPEEGYYLIAVKERNDDNESKPSNVVTVYLKSNVKIKNTTTLANDNSRLSAGPYKDNGRGRLLPWIQILIICIISALVLFIIILVIICLTIRRYRRTNKDAMENDYKSSNDNNVSNAKNDSKHSNNKQSYFNAQDGNSLISNSLNDNNRIAPNSSASNHTSCSSVNTTVDNGNGYLEPQHTTTSIDRGQSDRISLEPPAGPTTQGNVMKELNVATLLPNSWDAKELLDHWGRVQEAKLRQESPSNGIANGQHGMHSNSPSVLSYAGSSSIDNYHNNHTNNHVNLSFTHQQPPSTMIHSPTSSSSIGQFGLSPTALTSTSAAMYSPYSNASSIWQHQKQLQQQQQQQHNQQLHNQQLHNQQLHNQQIHSYLSLPSPPPPPPPSLSTHHHHHHQHQQQHLSSSMMNNIDDNGLPEYSVVHKIISANISQV